MYFANQVFFNYYTCTDAEDAQFLGLLVKHFKLSAFKDWQVKAIKATINGRDTFVNQPTGMPMF